MSVQQRNNVNVTGSGSATLFLSHGFGCDQRMWRFVVPALAQRYRIVTLDLVGSGRSDLSAYDPLKYDRLNGYADDLLEVVERFAEGPAVMVGHSASAMIGALADLQAPGRFAAHVMIGPSPCYLNDGDYRGGFEPADIDNLLQTLDSNYLGWASTTAPAIMGAPGQPELSEELTRSFCNTDPEVAKQFARVIFTGDHRAELKHLHTPTLVLLCTDDMIVPPSVGEYLQATLSDCTLHWVENTGHLPHASAPDACIAAINAYLPTRLGVAHAR
jgi:sigma-B regulation protein RsbQ